MKRILIVISLMTALSISTAVFAQRTPDPVRIAVIDTGISAVAIDSSRIIEGYNYIRPKDGIEDRIGHGTAIAGILVGSDKADTEGICPNAVLVPLVYATKDEMGKTIKGDTSMVAQAIYDAVDIYDCDIINISSGSTSDSLSLRNAAAYAEEKGVLVISSAGNSNLYRPQDIYYPGAYDTVLCVGSANSDGEVSPFSQRGNTIDILAPGSNLRVVSIRAKKIRAFGTSYSTAYVTAAAAKLLEQNPDLTPAKLRQILYASAEDIGEPGFDTDSGWGILNPATISIQEQLSFK
ncbi:MAG: S8 family serine peptidase [Clostridiaceae bacterium]|jgi:subtilisin family serine protease|nr:S8 family serine peptidase [Clostridiaceae bacterium]